MEIAELMARHGGIARWGELEPVISRRRLRRALAAGEVIRLRRDAFALPDVGHSPAAARRVGGVVSHLSAALAWEWKVLDPPQHPVLTVPLRRALTPQRRGGTDVRWADLPPGDVIDGRTSRLRTVTDCARTLPFPAALAVADSALREGLVSPAQLRVEADGSPRTGRAAAQHVARHADGRAANPFESALRAICLDVPHLRVTPQVWVESIGRADLVDESRALVIEAESWEFHGTQQGFARDIRRYTAMVAAGWTVVRFTWHEVMHDPDWVRQVLTVLVERGPDPRAVGRIRRPRAA